MRQLAAMLALITTGAAARGGPRRRVLPSTCPASFGRVGVRRGWTANCPAHCMLGVCLLPSGGQPGRRPLALFLTAGWARTPHWPAPAACSQLFHCDGIGLFQCHLHVSCTARVLRAFSTHDLPNLHPLLRRPLPHHPPRREHAARLHPGLLTRRARPAAPCCCEAACARATTPGRLRLRARLDRLICLLALCFGSRDQTVGMA